LNKLPLVSIIIVNHNGKHLLLDCFKSLSYINYPNYEIVLVDNNSTDNSLEFIKDNYPRTIIIRLEKNYGYAEPNNIGAKKANGKYLLFLNNDTKVTPNFLNELVHAIESDEKIAICQSLLLRFDGTVDSAGDFVDKYGCAFSSKTIPKKTSPIFSARGACMMIKKNVFNKLEGFDEKFFASFEDVDLGWRAWINEYKVVIVPQSVVFHHAGGTISTMSEEIKFHGVKNTLVLRLTNFETIQCIKSLVTLFFVTTVRRFFGISMISDPETPPPLPSIKIILNAVFWVIKNWKYVINKRKKINSMRRLSTSELIKKQLIT
jgi:GT2 family glycosyltransferase